MMKWLIGFVTGVILNFLEWLVKRFGISKTVIVIQITVLAAYVAFLLSAVTFIVLYLFKLWNLFKDLLQQLGNSSTVSGEAYGITLSTIMNNVWGFMQSSGISDALVISMDLFIGLLSIFFTIQAYKLFIFATDNVVSLINDLLALITR